MFNISKKVPVGVLALGLVSFLGLKDTGIFISDHVQTTYSGNQVYFEKGEQANIIEVSERGYVVAKGKARVTIPSYKIAVTEKNVSTYKVVAPTPIKNDQGDILRNLIIGENVTLVSNAADTLVVTTQDGLTGKVAASALELVGTSVEKIALDAATETAKLSADEAEIAAVAVAPQTYTAVLTAVAAPSAPATGTAKVAIDSALSKLGSPYVWGSTGAEGYDCSGLVYAVYVNELGVKLPRTSSDMSQTGTQVSRENLQPGDLVFFNTGGSGVSHVGIYEGNGNFIHASSGSGKVIVSNLSEDYYNARYTNATRVL
ncbi:C40 family peptidase [Peptoniphilus equinus]|uniref:C40 family peptidase n=1 Tax=Peptoniphilus equinus TaxID=3016343 RepID=A0ABY7QUC8_9FIRM|nr:C40 family peptidase [Peptoniphilus equinus]WBW50390.1 C40 family peptidase [Peptoniphilus equinus]